jgi:ribonucleoside-diphosphate reductase alpha chain
MTHALTQVRKRDGRLTSFDASRIILSVNQAQAVVGQVHEFLSREVAGAVMASLAAQAGEDEAPAVEVIQDTVEKALVERGRDDLAKAYIIYRHHAGPVPAGIQYDLNLSLNAIHILERRYLVRDVHGHPVETPSEMFRRVARAMAAVESRYGGSVTEMEEKFFRMMASLDFLPNSPTLMNAGREMGQLSACFVLPVSDSMEGIFDAVKYMALIHQSGGGTGFNFSRLRPRNARVKSTGGVASGPVSFIRVFDQATDVIKQGGRRRGANMAILRVDHPDILEFVTSKAADSNVLRNFNISVAVTDDFMNAVREDTVYALRDPVTSEVVEERRARQVFDVIAKCAWRCGDPGLVFIDEVNRLNPVAPFALIESTNPCGEQPLLPYESCNLGSITLSRFVKDGGIDYDRLGEVVDLAVRFLDDVIDANRYPIPQVAEVTLSTRKIGLGIMGFADTLFLLGIPYGSDDGTRLAEEVMRFLTHRARRMSDRLGGERGPFPLFEKSTLKAQGWRHQRNLTTTTIAPTGTIGLIAGTSSGIEPVFALRYWRTMAEGVTLIETHPAFEKALRDLGVDADELFRACAKHGSIQSCESLPASLRRTYVVARDIAPEWHVRMQAAFQRHTDNGVSKTVNLPHTATVEDVSRIYLLAHELGCKGITVYREGSREEDLLHAGPADLPATPARETSLPACSLAELLDGVETSGSRCRCP